MTNGTWETNLGRYQEMWPNVMPVTWAYVYDLYQRGAIGPDV